MGKKQWLVLVLLLLVVGMVGSAQGYFRDEFNTYGDAVPEPNIPGVNGWVRAYDVGGNLMEPAVVQAQHGYERAEEAGLGVGWGTPLHSGAGRDITGDVEDGRYEVSMTMYGQYTGGAYVDQKLLLVGNTALTTGSANLSCHAMIIDDRNTVNILTLRTYRSGAFDLEEDVNMSWDSHPVGWYDYKISVNYNTGEASAWYRNVQSTGDHEPLGDWTKLGDFAAPIPYATPEVAAFGVRDYAVGDNFVSGFKPGPVDCAAALEEGYSLTYDLDGDCYVGLADFALIANDWLRCIDPDDPTCDKPWQ